MTLNATQFQGEQLPMFMTARDLYNNTQPGDARESAPQMWNSKLREARVPGSAEDSSGASLRDSVRSSGVRTPVTVLHGGWIAGYQDSDKPILWNGHHRVVSAINTNPDQLVPVEHIDRHTAPLYD